jgi:hypothetical protein
MYSTSRIRARQAVKLDADSFFRYQKFYGTDQISESLRVGDEHIGPDGRSRVSRFKDETRGQALKKSTDVHVEVVAVLQDPT